MLAGRLLAGFAAAGYAPSIQIFVAEITEVGQQFMFLFSYEISPSPVFFP